MTEKIKELWLACEMGLDSYEAHGDDDLGRLQIIQDHINHLIRLKNKVVEFKTAIKYEYYLCD